MHSMYISEILIIIAVVFLLLETIYFSFSPKSVFGDHDFGLVDFILLTLAFISCMSALFVDSTSFSFNGDAIVHVQESDQFEEFGYGTLEITVPKEDADLISNDELDVMELIEKYGSDYDGDRYIPSEEAVTFTIDVQNPNKTIIKEGSK